ncbi:MAG TPA: glycosyltransferase family A protein [Anaerolineales bacterium]
MRFGNDIVGLDPLVSVVVPTRNRCRLLPHLLAALDGQTYANLEIVIVDDASEDATPAVLSRWAGARKKVIRLDRSGGSYAARNLGWKIASGDLIAFTDDDCRPDPGWIAALTKAWKASAAPGVQGVTLAQPGRITPFTHQIDQRRPGPPYRTCNAAYSRRVLRDLGGFDDSLRWYADNIFGLRVQALGRIDFAPDAVVLHPPRPREWRDRATWLARFDADARHRAALHALDVEPVSVPSTALPVVLWMLRPLLRQTAAHIRYGLLHPQDYFQQLPTMVHEKRELLAALLNYWRCAGASRPSRAPDLPPLPSEPLVSAVIVTRDRDHLLQHALESLTLQSWQRLEIIVVDHANRPETRSVAERFEAKWVPAPGVTLAAARQVGVDSARGEIVAFMDDDCVASGRWVEALVHAFQRDRELRGVQGRTQAEPGPVGWHAISVKRESVLFETCNIAYLMAALEQSGGFDLRFRGWFEDSALAARVLRQGRIGFAPDARVVHCAVPRPALSRTQWGILLRDERLLAEAYPAFYRCARGPGFLSSVVARWLVGSPVKALLRNLAAGLDEPPGYGALAYRLLRERWNLLLALYDLYFTAAVSEQSEK